MPKDERFCGIDGLRSRHELIGIILVVALEYMSIVEIGFLRP